ncbi:MAG: PIN domain-containing protein [Desulfococcaceae bacterium]|jgi:predicted nucleic acid-binding protein|nr:PIN domain-containing protein [Desulfococcaceae bacterium]
MKIYFDVCCLNRPYDDQTQDRVHLETVAIMAILKHIELKEWLWISSAVVNYEISQTTDEERKCRLYSLVRWATEFVTVEQDSYNRAKEIQQQLGIKAYDALHIACAEKGGADVFLSTDDKLIKASNRKKKAIKIQVENPLKWLQEVIL